LRNFEGVITTYEEPDDYTPSCKCKEQEKQIGVSALLSGEKITIEPSDLERNLRKKRLTK
jgi:lysine 2,3-aminomutase